MHQLLYNTSSIRIGRTGCLPFHLYKSFLNVRIPDWPASGQSGDGMNKVQIPKPVRYRNKGPSPVPECPDTGLRCRMPECRCRRHGPRCQCPAMVITHVGGVHMHNLGDIISYLIVVVPGRGKDLSTLTNGGMCQPSQMPSTPSPNLPRESHCSLTF
jgi:hypothetical protein